MTEHNKQKYREAIHSKYSDWSDNQVDLIIELIEVISDILE